MSYRPSEIEPRWQEHWETHGSYVARLQPGRPKFYALDMFPYPSGKGLHVGHPAGYTASDIMCRYKRARGFNVLHPIGYDSFGLPAEQKAIDEGVAPQESTAEAIETFRRQLKRLGYSYDWTREISTADPSYYRWTQWIFTRLHARGDAYVGESTVNWCPALGTVLANDEVIEGKSERGGHPVEKVPRSQWMLKITAYADRLLSGLEGIDWPEATKAAQREWIGREEGPDGATYRIHDWVFARQRYWGEPIPVLKDGGTVVRVLDPEELPLTLPSVEDYAPTGTGESPLSRADGWVEVNDPVTGRRLRREVDTMPGSAGSSWYFLRYCDPHNDEEFCSREASDYWMPVDLYVGGAEHRVGHLLYARMWQKVLFDEGLVRDEEPFAKLRHQGMVLAKTYTVDGRTVVPTKVHQEDGKKATISVEGMEGTVVASVRWEKMSKRKGNVVNPEDVIDQYGVDALRVYLSFLTPLEGDKPWQTEQLKAQFDWLNRVWRLFFDENDVPRAQDLVAPTPEEMKVIHRAIDKVTRDIEALSLNTAISALHVASRELARLGSNARHVLKRFAQLLAPFAPHLAETLWTQGLGYDVTPGGIAYVPWPEADSRWIEEDTVSIGVQVRGRFVCSLDLPPGAPEDVALKAAMALAVVRSAVGSAPVARVIYKAGKILNLIPG